MGLEVPIAFSIPIWGDFLKSLDLEETTDHQYPDQEGEALHRVQGPLLLGITGGGFIGGLDISSLDIVDPGIRAVRPWNLTGLDSPTHRH